MATIPQIISISKLHGKTARAVSFAMLFSITTIKTITPKTITKR